MQDEDIWKARFHQLTAVRLTGIVMFMLGMAVMMTDLVRVGGLPRLGAVMVIAGALVSLLAPKVLKRFWTRP